MGRTDEAAPPANPFANGDLDDELWQLLHLLREQGVGDYTQLVQRHLQFRRQLNDSVTLETARNTFVKQALDEFSKNMRAVNSSNDDTAESKGTEVRNQLRLKRHEAESRTWTLPSEKCAEYAPLLRDYNALVGTLHAQAPLLGELLLQAKSGDVEGLLDLCAALFPNPYDSEDELQLLRVVQHCLTLEFAKCTDISTYLRENSAAAKLLTYFARRDQGQDALRRILADPLKKLLSDPSLNLSINPHKIASEKGQSGDVDSPRIADIIRKRTQQLIEACDWFFSAIVESNLPEGMRCICRMLASLVNSRYPGNERLSDSLVGGFTFLRYINPVIINPASLELETHWASKVTSTARRNLILITKVLQNLSNGVRFGDKEPYMIPLNKYLDQRSEELHNWFLRCTEVDSLSDRLQRATELRLLPHCATVVLTGKQIMLMHQMVCKYIGALLSPDCDTVNTEEQAEERLKACQLVRRTLASLERRNAVAVMDETELHERHVKFILGTPVPDAADYASDEAVGLGHGDTPYARVVQRLGTCAERIDVAAVCRSLMPALRIVAFIEDERAVKMLLTLLDGVSENESFTRLMRLLDHGLEAAEDLRLRSALGPLTQALVSVEELEAAEDMSEAQLHQVVDVILSEFVDECRRLHTLMSLCEREVDVSLGALRRVRIEYARLMTQVDSKCGTDGSASAGDSDHAREVSTTFTASMRQSTATSRCSLNTAEEEHSCSTHHGVCAMLLDDSTTASALYSEHARVGALELVSSVFERMLHLVGAAMRRHLDDFASTGKSRVRQREDATAKELKTWLAFPRELPEYNRLLLRIGELSQPLLDTVVQHLLAQLQAHPRANAQTVSSGSSSSSTDSCVFSLRELYRDMGEPSQRREWDIIDLVAEVVVADTLHSVLEHTPTGALSDIQLIRVTTECIARCAPVAPRKMRKHMFTPLREKANRAWAAVMFQLSPENVEFVYDKFSSTVEAAARGTGTWQDVLPYLLSTEFVQFDLSSTRMHDEALSEMLHEGGTKVVERISALRAFLRSSITMLNACKDTQLLLLLFVAMQRAFRSVDFSMCSRAIMQWPPSADDISGTSAATMGVNLPPPPPGWSRELSELSRVFLAEVDQIFQYEISVFADNRDFQLPTIQVLSAVLVRSPQSFFDRQSHEFVSQRLLKSFGSDKRHRKDRLEAVASFFQIHGVLQPPAHATSHRARPIDQLHVAFGLPHTPLRFKSTEVIAVIEKLFGRKKLKTYAEEPTWPLLVRVAVLMAVHDFDGVCNHLLAGLLSGGKQAKLPDNVLLGLRLLEILSDERFGVLEFIQRRQGVLTGRERSQGSVFRPHQHQLDSFAQQLAHIIAVCDACIGFRRDARQLPAVFAQRIRTPIRRSIEELGRVEFVDPAKELRPVDVVSTGTTFAFMAPLGNVKNVVSGGSSGDHVDTELGGEDAQERLHLDTLISALRVMPTLLPPSLLEATRKNCSRTGGFIGKYVVHADARVAHTAHHRLQLLMVRATADRRIALLECFACLLMDQSLARHDESCATLLLHMADLVSIWHALERRSTAPAPKSFVADAARVEMLVGWVSRVDAVALAFMAHRSAAVRQAALALAAQVDAMIVLARRRLRARHASVQAVMNSMRKDGGSTAGSGDSLKQRELTFLDEALDELRHSLSSMLRDKGDAIMRDAALMLREFSPGNLDDAARALPRGCTTVHDALTLERPDASSFVPFVSSAIARCLVDTGAHRMLSQVRLYLLGTMQFESAPARPIRDLSFSVSGNDGTAGSPGRQGRSQAGVATDTGGGGTGDTVDGSHGHVQQHSGIPSGCLLDRSRWMGGSVVLTANSGSDEDSREREVDRAGSTTWRNLTALFFACSGVATSHVSPSSTGGGGAVIENTVNHNDNETSDDTSGSSLDSRYSLALARGAQRCTHSLEDVRQLARRVVRSLCSNEISRGDSDLLAQDGVIVALMQVHWHTLSDTVAALWDAFERLSKRHRKRALPTVVRVMLSLTRSAHFFDGLLHGGRALVMTYAHLMAQCMQELGGVRIGKQGWFAVQLDFLTCIAFLCKQLGRAASDDEARARFWVHTDAEAGATHKTSPRSLLGRFQLRLNKSKRKLSLPRKASLAEEPTTKQQTLQRPTSPPTHSLSLTEPTVSAAAHAMRSRTLSRLPSSNTQEAQSTEDPNSLVLVALDDAFRARLFRWILDFQVRSDQALQQTIANLKLESERRDLRGFQTDMMRCVWLSLQYLTVLGPVVDAPSGGIGSLSTDGSDGRDTQVFELLREKKDRVLNFLVQGEQEGFRCLPNLLALHPAALMSLYIDRSYNAEPSENRSIFFHALASVLSLSTQCISSGYIASPHDAQLQVMRAPFVRWNHMKRTLRANIGRVFYMTLGNMASASRKTRLQSFLILAHVSAMLHGSDSPLCNRLMSWRYAFEAAQAQWPMQLSLRISRLLSSRGAFAECTFDLFKEMFQRPKSSKVITEKRQTWIASCMRPWARNLRLNADHDAAAQALRLLVSSESVLPVPVDREQTQTGDVDTDGADVDVEAWCHSVLQLSSEDAAVSQLNNHQSLLILRQLFLATCTGAQDQPLRAALLGIWRQLGAAFFPHNLAVICRFLVNAVLERERQQSDDATPLRTVCAIVLALFEKPRHRHFIVASIVPHIDAVLEDAAGATARDWHAQPARAVYLGCAHVLQVQEERRRRTETGECADVAWATARLQQLRQKQEEQERQQQQQQQPQQQQRQLQQQHQPHQSQKAGGASSSASAESAAQCAAAMLLDLMGVDDRPLVPFVPRLLLFATLRLSGGSRDDVFRSMHRLMLRCVTSHSGVAFADQLPTHLRVDASSHTRQVHAQGGLTRALTDPSVKVRWSALTRRSALSSPSLHSGATSPIQAVSARDGAVVTATQLCRWLRALLLHLEHDPFAFATRHDGGFDPVSDADDELQTLQQASNSGFTRHDDATVGKDAIVRYNVERLLATRRALRVRLGYEALRWAMKACQPHVANKALLVFRALAEPMDSVVVRLLMRALLATVQDWQQLAMHDGDVKLRQPQREQCELRTCMLLDTIHVAAEQLGERELLSQPEHVSLLWLPLALMRMPHAGVRTRALRLLAVVLPHVSYVHGETPLPRHFWRFVDGWKPSWEGLQAHVVEALLDNVTGLSGDTVKSADSAVSDSGDNAGDNDDCSDDAQEHEQSLLLSQVLMHVMQVYAPSDSADPAAGIGNVCATRQLRLLVAITPWLFEHLHSHRVAVADRCDAWSVAASLDDRQRTDGQGSLPFRPMYTEVYDGSERVELPFDATVQSMCSTSDSSDQSLPLHSVLHALADVLAQLDPSAAARMHIIADDSMLQTRSCAALAQDLLQCSARSIMRVGLPTHGPLVGAFLHRMLTGAVSLMCAPSASRAARRSAAVRADTVLRLTLLLLKRRGAEFVCDDIEPLVFAARALVDMPHVPVHLSATATKLIIRDDALRRSIGKSRAGADSEYTALTNESQFVRQPLPRPPTKLNNGYAEANFVAHSFDACISALQVVLRAMPVFPA
ncbi:MAG: hypothetical protein MHM6MM_000643 [Cercozoa sp. M6MM]